MAFTVYNIAIFEVYMVYTVYYNIILTVYSDRRDVITLTAWSKNNIITLFIYPF